MYLRTHLAASGRIAARSSGRGPHPAASAVARALPAFALVGLLGTAGCTNGPQEGPETGADDASALSAPGTGQDAPAGDARAELSRKLRHGEGAATRPGETGDTESVAEDGGSPPAVDEDLAQDYREKLAAERGGSPSAPDGGDGDAPDGSAGGGEGPADTGGSPGTAEGGGPGEDGPEPPAAAGAGAGEGDDGPVLGVPRAELLDAAERFAAALADDFARGDTEAVRKRVVDEAQLRSLVTPGSYQILSGTMLPATEKKLFGIAEAAAGASVSHEWLPGEIYATSTHQHVWAREVPMMLRGELTLEIDGAPLIVHVEQLLWLDGGWRVLRVR